MEQIGPYVLSHRIGAGGMAEVWMAHRATLGTHKTVAVKLLAPNLAGKVQYREMFLEEARLSMLLNHSNIVQVFELGEDCGEPYMAMEWIDGVNLAELQAMLWACGRAMPVDLAMYVTGELLRALDHAHTFVHAGAATIVHRDVSPTNVMLSLAGEVKLTDFGVARFGSEETSGIHVKGKLRYMAPEQLRGHSNAGTVDIYAVGAVLHEMLEGSKFRGSHVNEAQLIGTICESTMPELSEPARVSVQLDDLRRSMLAAEPGERINAETALLRLRQCPGYHHASHELAALVRWCRGVEPIESGVSADTRRDHSELCSAASRVRTQRLATALALVFAGLCVGCLGIGVAVSRWESTSASTPARATIVEHPPAAPEFFPLLPPLALAPARVPALTEPVPEPESELRVSPPVKHHSVEVKFVAGAFNYAYVKVGNKQALIEPGGALQLTPGIYKVQVRFSAQEEWVCFGKLDIRPKRSYLVKLVAPQRLEVKTLK